MKFCDNISQELYRKILEYREKSARTLRIFKSIKSRVKTRGFNAFSRFAAIKSKIIQKENLFDPCHLFSGSSWSCMKVSRRSGTRSWPPARQERILLTARLLSAGRMVWEISTLCCRYLLVPSQAGEETPDCQAVVRR